MSSGVGILRKKNLINVWRISSAVSNALGTPKGYMMLQRFLKKLGKNVKRKSKESLEMCHSQHRFPFSTKYWFGELTMARGYPSTLYIEIPLPDTNPLNRNSDRWLKQIKISSIYQFLFSARIFSVRLGFYPILATITTRSHDFGRRRWVSWYCQSQLWARSLSGSIIFYRLQR